MQFFQELFANKVFTSAALGWLVAQILKTLIHTFFTKEFDPETGYNELVITADSPQ